MRFVILPVVAALLAGLTLGIAGAAIVLPAHPATPEFTPPPGGCITDYHPPRP